MKLPAEKGTQKQEMTIYFPFLECCGIVEKIQENSMSSAKYIKAIPITDVGESSLRVYTQSLNVAGLGHTSVNHVGWYTDLVECVLVPVAVDQGRLIWIPESQHLCRGR